jgi:hypothetical protein
MNARTDSLFIFAGVLKCSFGLSPIERLLKAIMPMVLALSLDSGSDPHTCHIHAPVLPKADAPEAARVYRSLHECESANRKLYGGGGRCHCVPDAYMDRGIIDNGRFRNWELDTPQERLP